MKQIPEVLVRIVRSVLEVAITKVRVDYEFEVKVGMHQRSVL